MEPTIENSDFMFNGPPSLVKPFVIKLIEKLRKPDVRDEFALCYFVSFVTIQLLNSLGTHQSGSK